MKKHAKTRLEEGQDIQSTSWLPELAEHHVYDVESFTNLFSDLTVFFTQVGHMTISHEKKPSQVTINNQSGITRQRTNISPRKLHQMMRKN